MEPYQHGLAASVAVIGGPAGHVILPPCEQRIDKDGGLRYRGGRFPLGRSATAEAIELAGRVVDAIDPFVGYIGIDLVLTDHGPVAIEINPRLTTSYVGLRAATPSNLAEVMLSMAEGGKVVVTFTRQVSFSADGDVERMESLAKAEPFVSQWRPASRSACGGDNSRSQH